LKDLEFLAGTFFDFEVPKDKKFLNKYFKSPIERHFLKYFLWFNNIDDFTSHTGFYCQRRWLLLLKLRLERLLLIHSKAKSDFDLEFLSEIEMGKVKLNRIKKG